MKIVGFDVETSMKPVMFPYQKDAYLSTVGIYNLDGTYREWIINHDEAPDDNDVARNIKEIKAELESCDLVVGHNIKFDLLWVKAIGVDIHKFKVWDTMVTHYIQRGQRFNKRELSLEELSIYWGIPPKIDKVKQYWESGVNTAQIPLHILMPYLKQDCMNTLSIYKHQNDLMLKEKYQRKLILLHNEVAKELTDIEWNGMQVDEGLLAEFIDEFQEKQEFVYSKLRDLMSFYNGVDCMKHVDFDKAKHLSAALFGGIIQYDGIETVEYERWAVRKVDTGEVYKSGARVGQPVLRNERYKEPATRTRKCTIEKTLPGCKLKPPKGSEQTDSDDNLTGYYSTDKNNIPMLFKGANLKQKAILAWLEERSNVKKIMETFRGKKGNKGLVTKVMADGRVHPHYNQTITKTGRLSSSDPNGQNFPREGTSPLKKIFVSRHGKRGYILVADLAQLEWRVAACLSQDPVAIDEIQRCLDYHTENAIKLFGSKKFRQDAKVLGFRLLYGGTPYAFFMDTKMPDKTLQEWDKIVELYYSKYHKLNDWQVDLFRWVGQNVEVEPLPSGGEIVWGTYVSPTGRKYKFRQQPIKKMRGALGFKDTQVKNFQVQGTATGDIMPLAMVVIKKRLRDLQSKGQLLNVVDIGQVHDSILFDCTKEEVRQMADLCIQVYEDLPFLIAKWFGCQWNVPLTGDCAVGSDYGKKEYVAERPTIGAPTVFKPCKPKPDKEEAWTCIWNKQSGHLLGNIYSEKELEARNAPVSIP